MFSVDLHTHTRFFHYRPGRPTAYDPVGARLNAAVARALGLDGVAHSNHDYHQPFDTDLATIPANEVTTTHGHVLVVGPDPPSRTPPGELSPEYVVEDAHDRGCAAIVAHPYRNSTVREVDAGFDAVEVNGKHPRTREWVDRFAARVGLPTVGGSDAHYPPEVGRAYTEVDADELTPQAVVDAIRDGRVEPSVSEARPHRALRAVYRRIHSGKGQLDTPDWLTPGVGTPPEGDAE